MRRKLDGEEGFTLIEVLAATVILSVVSLAMMAFFLQAMSYNKSNQNKTVMVNLARNALFYMEKQRFSDVADYFASNEVEHRGENAYITVNDCNLVAESLSCTNGNKVPLLNRFQGIYNVLHPQVNGRTYDITVTYQSNLEKNNANVSQYLIPIQVSVQTLNADNSLRNQTVVEGYVLDEKIR
ncbi:type IV pilus modification PilV family protein [Paenibacillus hexagrammi]|uniref:Prepilin-type N-terminal cleavage/methylation domain-containing protein n=1 Tax=Paenibacillus hexagrammi TaxID=2908839 RepID=A0ABY3SR82_9BACL|nr:prepilin-type N-terminal cleavage/methylation domain-containing protein [Paenibacillus sp. YPD9-1]UJF35983.1 prepilin-type N-terminal cleavage/methylation domain-containing protein [Paenibacillus sp. YPD9-1]